MWKIQESDDHELWFLKKTCMPWKDVPGTVKLTEKWKVKNEKGKVKGNKINY